MNWRGFGAQGLTLAAVDHTQEATLIGMWKRERERIRVKEKEKTE